MKAPIWGAHGHAKVSTSLEKGESDVPECEDEWRFQAQLVAAMPHWLTTLINLAGAGTLLLFCWL